QRTARGPTHRDDLAGRSRSARESSRQSVANTTPSIDRADTVREDRQSATRGVGRKQDEAATSPRGGVDEMTSCGASPELRTPAPYPDKFAPRLPHRTHTLAGDLKVGLGSPAALACGLAQARCHEAFFLEAIQGDVDAAGGHFATARGLDGIGDRHALGVGAKPHHPQKHLELEDAERAPRHLPNNIM